MSGAGKFNTECYIWSIFPKINFTAVRLCLWTRRLAPFGIRSSPLSVAFWREQMELSWACLGAMSGVFHICVIIDRSGNRHGVLAKPAVRQMRNQFSKMLLFNEVYLITTKLVGKWLDWCHCATLWSNVITQRSDKEQYGGSVSVCVLHSMQRWLYTLVKYVVTDLSNVGNFIDRLFFLAVLGLCCCTQAFQAFLWLWRARATLRCGAWASHCGGFSLFWSTSSRHVGFSSCGTWPQ